MLLFAYELHRRFEPFWPRAVGACLLALLGSGSTLAAAEEQGLVVRSFLSDPPICRAGRSVSLTAVVVNDGRADAGVNAKFTLPPGVRLLAPEAPAPVRISMTEGEQQLRFVVEAQAGAPAEIVLDLATPGGAVVRQPLAIDFLPPVAAHKLDAVPPAEPVAPDMLVGAIHCPLWEADRVDLWLFSRALSTAEVRICWQASARPAAVGDDATRPERK